MAKNFLRQLKPIDENKTSHVQRIQSSYKGLSEAYDIIPTSELEIDELDIPHNKENLKALFVDITKSTGVGDPIAFSKNPKEKGIKVLRSVADELNLPALGKKYGFKLSAGNGSRGGTGTKSMGFGL